MKMFSLLLRSCIVCGMMAHGAVVSAQSKVATEGLSPHQQLARDIFRELIEINTSLDSGSTRAAEAMAARLRGAGFPASDIHLAGPHLRHMNLVVRYGGNGTRRPVIFIGHLDVVDAHREDWSCDPFTFIEQDGYFYGRGTSDMKCEDANLVATLIRLKHEGFVPDRDIIVALTEDEENGDANGIQWLLKNRRALVDAEYGINPDGGGGEIKNGKHIVMDVQTGEKIYCDYTLEVKNKGGHSSVPMQENAIYRLAAALTRVAHYAFPLSLNETTRQYFARNALLDTGQVREDLQAMAKPTVDTAAANRLAARSPYYNAMMRTTCVATMLSGGHAPNALPQTARANVNCRMLPEDTPEHVLAILRRVIADSLVTITRVSAPSPAPSSPLRRDLLDIIERITGQMWPGVMVTPVMSTGASDGKYLRAVGIPVYGISGMYLDIDDIRAHGRDERLGVKEFYEGVEFMYRLMKIVASGSEK